MATATSSTRYRHDSNATYQEWRDELITMLGTLSAKLTADETNITPGAGSIPAANVEQGYAVYHLNDSLHSTAPIYIRFGFSSGSTGPAITCTVGTSTNGSGVLGGTALTTLARTNSNGTQNTDTVRATYICATDGFFGLSHKVGAGTSEGFLMVARTVDAAGAITATGAHVWCGAGSASSTNKSQALRFASTAAAYTAQTTIAAAALGILPTAQVSTTVGSDFQAALAITAVPRATPLVGVCGVLDAEVPAGTTFTACMVGTPPGANRTYIGLSTVAGPFGPASAATGGFPKFAMLWE